MNKYFIAIALTLLLVLMTGAGCTTTGTTKVSGEDYHKGTQGLLINFLKNSPPTKMYENNDIKIALELRNKGTCDFDGITGCRGYIQIEGFDPNIFQFSAGLSSFLSSPFTGIYTQSIPPDLQGKSVYNSEGGYAVVSFPGDSSTDLIKVILPDDVDSYKPTILATACYTYITEASPVVCVDPDPYGLQIKDKVCSLRTETLTGGQGAPVAVTKVEESVITPTQGGPKYMQFKIFVSNVGKTAVGKKTSSEGTGYTGGGIVVDRDSVLSESGGLSGCGKIDQFNINKIRISGELSNTHLEDCQPNWEIRLDDKGSGFAVCKVRMSATQEAYTAPLHIKLEYGYITTVSTSVEVVQVPGEG